MITVVGRCCDRPTQRNSKFFGTMPGFIYSPLLWGLLAVGLPVLIHLINMLRHRRVPWAAMEFLVVSQKKNRTWVLFKQLLLLLLRMAVLATLVLVRGPAAVAEPMEPLAGRHPRPSRRAAGR